MRQWNPILVNINGLHSSLHQRLFVNELKFYDIGGKSNGYICVSMNESLLQKLVPSWCY